VGLKNLAKYEYSCVDFSWITNNCMQPFWRSLIEYFPEWLAPNLITLIGFFFVLISFFVTMYYSHDLSSEIPAWVAVLNCVCLFIYQTLDALDGKQARRTESSSALGELFDHGCDAITSVLFGITALASLRLGFGWVGYSQIVLLMLAFFVTQWEVYFTGKMILGYINVTEGQFLSIFIQIVPVFLGPEFWLDQQSILGFSFPRALWLLPFSTITYIFTILNSFYQIFNSKKINKIKAFVYLLPCFWIIALTTIWTHLSPEIHNRYGVIWYVTVGFLFANNISKLTTSRVCKVDWNIYQILLLPLVPQTIFAFVRLDINFQIYFLFAYCAIVVIGYIGFAICVIHDMTYQLNIYALKIVKKKK